MILLKLLAKFIKVLRSSESPNQVAWGFALGTIPGLTPINCLHNLVVLLLLIILRVNLAAALLALLFTSFFAWLLDPLFHTIGFYLLVDVPFIQSLWTELYNAPIAPLTRFNNTVVMGSFIVAVVLLVPHYLLFKLFINRYRESWAQKIEKWKIVKILKASKLVKLFIKLKKLGG